MIKKPKQTSNDFWRQRSRNLTSIVVPLELYIFANKNSILAVRQGPKINRATKNFSEERRFIGITALEYHTSHTTNDKLAPREKIGALSPINS